MKNSLIGKGEEMRKGFPRRLWKTREHLRVKIANYKLAADHWQIAVLWIRRRRLGFFFLVGRGDGDGSNSMAGGNGSSSE